MLLIRCRLISSIYFILYFKHNYNTVVYGAEKMNYRVLLGKNIRKHRKIKGFSQEKLAEICELHRTYIGAVERGERNISLDNIEIISNALEVQLNELFDN